MSAASPTFSDELLALGRRLAETYVDTEAEGALTEAARERVALAYARSCTQPRILIHQMPSRTGGQRTLVVMGHLFWIVEDGVPWCLKLSSDSCTAERPQTQLIAPYIKLAESFLTTLSRDKLQSGPWFLSSFSAPARILAKTWQDQDVILAFRRAKVAGGHERDCDFEENGHSKMRVIKGRPRNYTYFLRVIATGLRAVCQAIDPTILKRLRSLHTLEGHLANWLAAAPSAKIRQWREQALVQHSLILPKIFNKFHDKDVSYNSDVFDQLLSAIDQGPPLWNFLADSLNATSTKGYNRDSLEWYRSIGPGWWGKAQLRFLIHIRNTFPMAYRWRIDIVALTALGHGLHPRRYPTTRKGWLAFDFVARQLKNYDFMPERDHVETFLKDLPLDWADPIYTQMVERLPLLMDAGRWISNSWRNRLQQHLSWRQWENLTEVLHAIQDAHQHEEEEQVQTTDSYRLHYQAWLELARWPPAGVVSPWNYQGLEVHELLSLSDTEKEGKLMRHCVGNGYYAQQALLGECRLFSIRDPGQKQPLSTFEMVWNKKSRRLEIRQHYTYLDKAPSDQAKATLEAWLRAKRCAKGPWPPQQAAIAAMQQMRTYEANAQLHYEKQRADAFQAKIEHTLQQRFPALASVSVATSS